MACAHQNWLTCRLDGQRRTDEQSLWGVSVAMVLSRTKSIIRRLGRRILGPQELLPAVPSATPLRLRDRFQVGRGTCGEPTVLDWGADAKLRIGSFCSISSGVTILLAGDHHVRWITTYPFPAFRDSAKSIACLSVSKGDVSIGHDVWFGMNAMILSGTTIGNGAVIGASAVVAKDVPPYAVVVGNPATVVRKRFDDDSIAVLERTRWWDWPDDVLDEAMPILLADDVQELLRFAEVHASRILDHFSSRTPRQACRSKPDRDASQARTDGL